MILWSEAEIFQQSSIPVVLEHLKHKPVIAFLKRKECHTIMTEQGACNGHVN